MLEEVSVNRRLAITALLLALAPSYAAAQPASPARQAEVERKGAAVMPFDQNATMHVFEPTATGGRQVVMVTNGDQRQVALVRAHLRKEAAAFAGGDYADPARIHGTSMPGLRELYRTAARIAVAYANESDGASITFRSTDPRAVRAVHAWFAAQTADHGRHAGMRM